MKIAEVSEKIITELQGTLEAIDNDQAEILVQKICGANRVFLTGAGRSLLMVKCCAMRLMQMGFTVYVTGEVVTPSIRPGDLLIVASGSGETATVALMVKKAKAKNAEVALLTTAADSTIARMADLVILVDAYSVKTGDHHKKSIQIGDSLFELSTLLFLEAIVVRVVEMSGVEAPNKVLMQNHANLE